MVGLQKFKDALDIGHKMTNSFIIPYGTAPTITKEDIQRRYITRYFLQFNSDKMILEVDKFQYERFSKNSLYKSISFKWYILGSISFVTNKNATTLVYYNSKMQGLSRLIQSPLQYFLGD
jgi:hypothetical protein